jgi:diacylglycerol kinase family enzyme
MRTHPFLVINPSSGSGSPSPGELAEAAAGQGVETHLLRDGEDPGEVARAADAAILGMAGGDGSLAGVAAAALDRDLPFVCVPFGTRNHFARDLGLDRDDPLAALAAFGGRGVERLVDVGRVADRLFLNNVSFGVYAGLVHRREHHRRRDEALARARGLAAVARHRHRIHAVVNGEEIVARVVLVGNNRYELSLFTLGERERIDTGELHLWAAPGVLPRSWEERTAPQFRIDLPGTSVRAAIDGEPVVLEPPLSLESLHRALRVRVPATTVPDTEEGGAMHENPRASDEEQEEAQEGRQQEEEAMRYPEHDDPDEQRKRAHADSDE